MSYFDIINKLALKLDKYNNPANEKLAFYSSDFFNRFNKFYENSLKLINKIEKSRLVNIDESVNMFKNYDTLINDNNDVYNRSITNANSVYNFNIMSLNQKLDIRESQFDEQLKIIENKRFKAIANHRDKINDFEIDKNLNNKKYKDYIPNIKLRYEKLINFQNSIRDKANNQMHAKNSKELYNFSNESIAKIDELKTKLKNIENDILTIRHEIENNLNIINKSILDENVLINQKITNITKLLQQNIKLSENQSEIEITSLKFQLNELGEKYNEVRKDIMKNIKNIFYSIDNEIDKVNNDLSYTLNTIDTEYAVNRYLEEKKLNATITRNYKMVEAKAINLATAKRENNYAYKNFKAFEKFHNKYRNNIISSENNKINELKKKKYYYDLERKHTISVQNFNEKLDKIKVEKNIELVSKEKDIYGKILDNKVAIEINNIKVLNDINTMLLDQKIKEFEYAKSINLSDLETTAKCIKSDIELTSKLQELIKNKYEIADKLKNKLNDLTAILIIEKNKHLVQLNLENVNEKIALKNNQNAYFIQLENARKDKTIKLIDLNIDFLNKSLNNFQNSIEIEIEKASILHEYNLNSISAKKIYDDASSKNGLRIHKLDLDNKHIKDIIHLINSQISSSFGFYKAIITPYINNVNIDNELLINLNYFNNEFINYICNLFKELNLDLNKIIDSRILFEVGKKYELLQDEITKDYELKTEAILKRSEHIKETIENYRSTLHKFYIDLKTLQVNRNSYIKQRINVKTIDKEIKSLNKKIRKNTTLVSYLENSLSKLPKILGNLENNYISKIEKVDKQKKLNVSNTYSTIDSIDDNTSNLLVNILINYNYFVYDEIPDTKTFNKDLNYLVSIIEKNIYKYFRTIYYLLDSFYNLEFKNLKRVKNTYINTYNKTNKSLKSSLKKNSNDIEHKNNDNKRDFNEIAINYQNNINKIDLEFKKYSYNLNSKYQKDNKFIINQYNKIKNKYFKLFEACDANYNHIINTLTTDLINNEKNYVKKSSKLLKEHKILKKKYYQDNLNNKNNSNLALSKLPGFVKSERKRIKALYDSYNKDLSNSNKELDDKIKALKMQANLEIIEYKKELQKDIDTEKKNYLNEYKALKLEAK